MAEKHTLWSISHYVALLLRETHEVYRGPRVPGPGTVQLTVSVGGQPQVLHAVFDQLRELLPLGAAVQVESLLRDALGAAPRLGVPAAQPPRPLHALLPQQRVLRLVAARRVPMGALLLPGLVPLLGILTLVHVNGHLREGTIPATHLTVHPQKPGITVTWLNNYLENNLFI